MLFELLDQTNSRISALDFKHDTPKLLSELKRECPDYWKFLRKNMEKKGAKEEAIKLIEHSIATGLLSKIKDIPKIVKMMKSKMQTSPALRCALVGILALLVKPRDIIPDDAPGGYGFLDDAILLRAALIEYMKVMPPGATSVEQERKLLQFMSIGIPPKALPQLQSAIIGMQYGFSVFYQLPPEVLNMTTQMLIQNPMLAEIQSAPHGRQPSDVVKLPSAVEMRNMVGSSLIVEGKNVSMTFSDGSSAFLSETGDILIST